MITGEQKVLAVIAHLAYLLGGVGFIIAPLVIFLLKREDPFVYAHAKQALVAHLVILALSVITGILCTLIIGLLLVPVMAILWLLLLVTSIIASIRAADGRLYEYPFIQPLVEKF